MCTREKVESMGNLLFFASSEEYEWRESSDKEKWEIGDASFFYLYGFFTDRYFFLCFWDYDFLRFCSLWFFRFCGFYDLDFESLRPERSIGVISSCESDSVSSWSKGFCFWIFASSLGSVIEIPSIHDSLRCAREGEIETTSFRGCATEISSFYRFKF